ncbi:MAG: hypothetical protein K8R69_02140 [Deltaproteobacteria bacterium]|nr:hypothetical protein [Deltaproteobacteria bacterium]
MGAFAAGITGIIRVHRRDASKLWRELDDATRGRFEMAVEQNNEILLKLVNSGLSQVHLLEYFKRHAEVLPKIKAWQMQTLAAFSHLDRAFEAFSRIPWNSHWKFTLLIASLDAYVDGAQENLGHFQELYPNFLTCYRSLGKFGWSEARKFQFLLHSLRVSEEFAASAYEKISDFIEEKIPVWGAAETARFVERIGKGTVRHYVNFDALLGLMKYWRDLGISEMEQREIVYRVLEKTGETIEPALSVLEFQSERLTPETFSLVLRILLARGESEEFYNNLHEYLETLEGLPVEYTRAHLNFIADLAENFPLGAAMGDLARARKLHHPPNAWLQTVLPDLPDELALVRGEVLRFFETTGTFALEAFLQYDITRSEEGGKHYFRITRKDGSSASDPEEIKVLAPFIQDPAYFKLILKHLDLANSGRLKRRSQSQGHFYPLDPIDLLVLENLGDLTLLKLAVLLFHYHQAQDPQWNGLDPRAWVEEQERMPPR